MSNSSQYVFMNVRAGGSSRDITVTAVGLLSQLLIVLAAAFSSASPSLPLPHLTQHYRRRASSPAVRTRLRPDRCASIGCRAVGALPAVAYAPPSDQCAPIRCRSLAGSSRWAAAPTAAATTTTRTRWCAAATASSPWTSTCQVGASADQVRSLTELTMFAVQGTSIER